VSDHSTWCPQKYFAGHSDAARRMSDTYALHRIGAGYSAHGKWFAVRLDDGRTDDTLYDSKPDAIRHQHHDERFYTFVKIVAPTMTPCDAEVMLRIARNLHAAGFRMADPDDKHGGKEVIRRSTAEDQLAQMRGRNTNLIMPWEA